MKRLRSYVTKGYIQYVVIIFLGLISVAISLFKTPLWVSTATLAGLSAALAWLLLDTKVTLDKVERRLPLGNSLTKFEDHIEHIKKALSNADQVWLLTNSGVGWFRDFPELETVVQRSDRYGHKSRFLFLDPRDHDPPHQCRDYAFQMVFERTDFRRAFMTFKNYKHYREHVKNQICTLVRQFDDKADFRVIDHLPSWTLLIVQPQEQDNRSIVFVEFRPFKMGFRNRPVMKVTPMDGAWFGWFVDQFNDMWTHGQAQTLVSKDCSAMIASQTDRNRGQSATNN